MPQFPLASSPPLLLWFPFPLRERLWGEEFLQVVAWTQQPCPYIRVPELEDAELPERCQHVLIVVQVVTNILIPPLAFFIAGGRGQWGPLAGTNSSVTYNRVA